ncbi:GntR family transcriptional regulator [Compostimonas suwonensis]|uniref:DNA-binding GntR family transcriptional regulator n=1 Tax=Compostimonas suwonensis TaxID=1048394 RepID=A0A2M9C5C7_9MICO|nr:GntR family transcriptional regulator [Compostimonas suwonensis]PJJ65677.1 DNA-binding GntR family transcriptional regulator [Compostimonas suwonensis]
MTIAPSSIQRLEQAVSLRDSVERSLSAAIISGELEPGTLVSVPTLAVQFAVSATPVREAMLNLEKRGFVEPVRNKGFRVTDVSERDLLEIVQVRRMLEVPAMRVVAEHFPHELMSSYRAKADAIMQAAARSDFLAYLSADSEFHLALLRVTGNERLVELVAELRSQTRMIGLANMTDTVELQQSANEHHLLLDYLSEGRADDAEKLMNAHIGHVVGWWAGLTENEPSPESI